MTRCFLSILAAAALMVFEPDAMLAGQEMPSAAKGENTKPAQTCPAESDRMLFDLGIFPLLKNQTPPDENRRQDSPRRELWFSAAGYVPAAPLRLLAYGDGSVEGEAGQAPIRQLILPLGSHAPPSGQGVPLAARV